MAHIEFSQGKLRNNNLYKIGNNPNYGFINKFEYDVAYDFLSAHMSLISGVALEKKIAVETGNNRSDGSKKAKRRKAESKSLKQ